MEPNESMAGKQWDYIPPELYQKAAKDFSEGNPELEKLLLYCFENGIKTVACCAGHQREGDREHNPYISFEYNEKSLSAIYKIMARLAKNHSITIDFSTTNDERHRTPDKTARHFTVRADLSHANELFSQIKEACESPNEIHLSDLDETDQTIFRAMNQEFGTKEYLKVRRNYNSHNGKLRYYLNMGNNPYVDNFMQTINEKHDVKISGLTLGYCGKEDTKKILEDIILLKDSKVPKSNYNIPSDKLIFSYLAKDSMHGDGGSLFVHVENGANIEQFSQNLTKQLNTMPSPFKTWGIFDGITLDPQQYSSHSEMVKAYETMQKEHQQYEYIKKAIHSKDANGKIASRESLVDAIREYIKTKSNLFNDEIEGVKLSINVSPKDMLNILINHYIDHTDDAPINPQDKNKPENILKNAVILTRNKYRDTQPLQAFDALYDCINYSYFDRFTNDNNARTLLRNNLTRDDVLRIIIEDFIDRELEIPDEKTPKQDAIGKGNNETNEPIVDLRDVLNEPNNDSSNTIMQQIEEIRKQKEALNKRIEKLDAEEQELLTKLGKAQQSLTPENNTSGNKSLHKKSTPQHMQEGWKMRSVEDIETTVGKGNHGKNNGIDR